MAKIRDGDRARKTLYVTGYDRKRTTKDLLRELFTQGGPVVDITMFDTHAYVLFQHEESVPYCLALFNDVEMFGSKLRMSPRFKTENTFAYVDYLSQVKCELRDRNMRQTPPDLPPKIYPSNGNGGYHNNNYRTNPERRKKYKGHVNSIKKNKKSKSRVKSNTRT